MGRKSSFGHLFSPVVINGMTVKNRIAMAPMGTSFSAEDGLVTPRAIDYYEERARGGAGMVIVENAIVDFYHGTHHANRFSIDGDFTLPGLTALSGAIKKHGARAVIQLNHAGRVARTKYGGFQPVAPSAVAFPGGVSAGGEMPRELTPAEIPGIVRSFADAALRARKAGFDAVEIHAAHGYLIAQFLSQFSNKRRDEYGGSLENRARFLLDILRAAREKVGRDYPLWCRLNAREYGAPSGTTLEEASAVAAMINDKVDAIHVSVFGYGANALVVNPETPGALLPLASAIKQAVSVPVIAVGRMSPALADQAIAEGKADIIAFGRAFIADPHLPRKAAGDRPEDIRPCIACYYCQDNPTDAVACSVNGAAGKEGDFRTRRTKAARRIAVIGGGPAGMEGARVLALRGHNVTLFEKESCLGGQLNLAMVPPGKKARLQPLLAYFAVQLDKLDVDVRLKTEPDIDTISSFRPDAVILASGAVPILPRLPGSEGACVVNAWDVLSGKCKPGHKTVVVGGGSVGCETADYLFESGMQVTVVEMLPRLAADMGFRDRIRLMNRLSALAINVITGVRCCRIEPGGIFVARDDKEELVEADTIIMAVGSCPNNGFYEALRASGIETHLAGDCWRVGRLAQAISDGLRLGMVL